MLRNCLEEDVCLYCPNAHWEGEFEWLKTPRTTAGELQIMVESRLGVRKLEKNWSNSTYITTCCLGRFQEYISLLIQKQTSAYSVVRHDWNFKWDWLLWSDETNKKLLFSSKHSRWVWWTQGKKYTSVQWNILLYFWCCGPIFLLEVLDIFFRHMASWILSNTNR